MPIHQRQLFQRQSRELQVDDQKDRSQMLEIQHFNSRRQTSGIFLGVVLCCVSFIFYFVAPFTILSETATNSKDNQLQLRLGYYDNIRGEQATTNSSRVSKKDDVPSLPQIQKLKHTEKEWKESNARLENKTIQQDDAPKNFQECQLKLEKYLYPRIYQWVMDKVPIAVNVKIISKRYHIIFNTGYIDPDIWYNAEYHCNQSNESANVLSATKPGRGNLIIQCPESIHANETDLVSASVITKEGNKTEYEMKNFVECERLDIRDYSPPKTEIGMCTSIAGKGKIRVLAHQWVEYHRLIGVDHTWIYLNSEWDGNQPQRPYISWIPYNLNIKAYNFTKRPWTQRSEFFRVTSQVECVLRARRMGIQWIVFTDVDEYVAIHDNSTIDITITNSTLPPLKKLLYTYYNSERKDIGGLVMNSIPFGNNLELEKASDKELLIDHVYRNKQPPRDATWTRWKQIVNPQNVHNYAIHWLGGGSALKEVRLDANRVRINHYKEVDKGVGVFQTTNANDLVKDTALADEFHHLVMNAMKERQK
mmetsp:Transcript_8161/g.15360  ORF Transcript_8161/g.15360 Transcript_8161/m.15360 type:complete len:534 (-) Transcript_8161:1596-3197(-)